MESFNRSIDIMFREHNFLLDFQLMSCYEERNHRKEYRNQGHEHTIICSKFTGTYLSLILI